MILPFIPKDAPYASQLRLLREDLGLSQAELADALGFGPNGERVVRSWENGDQQPNPTSWKAMRYLAILVAVYRGMDREKDATVVLGSFLPETLR